MRCGASMPSGTASNSSSRWELGLYSCHWVAFKNTHELLQFQRCIKTAFQVYRQDILCMISKVFCEIPHKISNPYIENVQFIKK